MVALMAGYREIMIYSPSMLLEEVDNE